jgi:hypothetical protein
LKTGAREERGGGRVLVEELPRATGVWLVVCQMRAIFLKTATFQSRQTVSNVYQLLHLLVCIFLIWLVNHNMSMHRDVKINSKLAGEIPMFLNLPSILDKSSTSSPIAISDCNRRFAVRANFPAPAILSTSGGC